MTKHCFRVLTHRSRTPLNCERPSHISLPCAQGPDLHVSHLLPTGHLHFLQQGQAFPVPYCVMTVHVHYTHAESYLCNTAFLIYYAQTTHSKILTSLSADHVPQHVKRVTHHEQVKFTPGTKGCFTTHKSTDTIHTFTKHRLQCTQSSYTCQKTTYHNSS